MRTGIDREPWFLNGGKGRGASREQGHYSTGEREKRVCTELRLQCFYGVLSGWSVSFALSSPFPPYPCCSSKAVPVVTLTEIFRQSQQSSIVLNAHQINKGHRVVLHTLQPPPPLPVPSPATPPLPSHTHSSTADDAPATSISSNGSSPAADTPTATSSSRGTDASPAPTSSREGAGGASVGQGPRSGVGRGRGRSRWNVEDLPSDCVLLRVRGGPTLSACAASASRLVLQGTVSTKGRIRPKTSDATKGPFPMLARHVASLGPS